MDGRPVRYLTSTEVRTLFGGISPVTLFRWIRDEKVGFPQPLRINKRRLFDEREIADFAARQRAKAAA